MKLNTPSTWTNQKIASLFLLSLLRIKEIKAGQNFKDCLASENASSVDAYDRLTTFPFSNSEYQTNLTTNGIKLRVCCDTSSCSSAINLNCVNGKTGFYCKKLGQTIFCSSISSSCGGIAGNTLITTDYNSNTTSCPSIQTVANNLTGVTIDHGYAKGYCTGDSNCKNLFLGYFSCFLDNGGWSCCDYLSYDCWLQWTNSSSTQLSLTSSTISFFSSSTSFTSSSYIPLPTISNDNSNSNNLNIILPTTIGGTVIIVTASGCYIIRKKRKNKTLQETQKSAELETTQEIPILPTTAEEIDLMELPTYSLSSPNEREEREVKNQQELSQKPHAIEELRVSDAERENNYHQLLAQIKAKLGNEQELLGNFLDAQEIIKQVPNSVQAQRNYQRVKQLLGQKISWTEMDALENSYLQKPHEQYHAYTESGPSHRTGDVHLAR